MRCYRRRVRAPGSTMASSHAAPNSFRVISRGRLRWLRKVGSRRRSQLQGPPSSTICWIGSFYSRIATRRSCDRPTQSSSRIGSRPGCRRPSSGRGMSCRSSGSGTGERSGSCDSGTRCVTMLGTCAQISPYWVAMEHYDAFLGHPDVQALTVRPFDSLDEREIWAKRNQALFGAARGGRRAHRLCLALDNSVAGARHHRPDMGGAHGTHDRQRQAPVSSGDAR
jgi:hypothetical protein